MRGLQAVGVGHAVLASAAFVIVSGRVGIMAKDSSAILVSGAGLSGAAMLVLGVTLASGGFRSGLGMVPDMSSASIWLAIYLGVVPTALAYILFTHGMSLCRSASAGLLATMIEPAIAPLLASLLIGEHLAPAQAAGCVLLLASALSLLRGAEIAATPGKR